MTDPISQNVGQLQERTAPTVEDWLYLFANGDDFKLSLGALKDLISQGLVTPTQLATTIAAAIAGIPPYANPMLGVGSWDLTPVSAPAQLVSGDNRPPFSAPASIANNTMTTTVGVPGLAYNNARFPAKVATQGIQWAAFQPDISGASNPAFSFIGVALTPDIFTALTAGGPALEIAYQAGQGLLWMMAGGSFTVIDAAYDPSQSFLVAVNGANGTVTVQTEAAGNVILGGAMPANSYLYLLTGLYSADGTQHTIRMQVSTDATNTFGRTVPGEASPFMGIGPAPLPHDAADGKRYRISQPGPLLRPDLTQITVPAGAVVGLIMDGHTVDYEVDYFWSEAALQLLLTTEGLNYRGDFAALWGTAALDGLYSSSISTSFAEPGRVNNDLYRFVPAGALVRVTNGLPDVICGDMAYEHARLPSADFGQEDIDTYSLFTASVWRQDLRPAMNPNWGAVSNISEGQFEFRAQLAQNIAGPGGPSEYVLGICLPTFADDGTLVPFNSYANDNIRLGCCFVWLDFVTQSCWVSTNTDGTTRKYQLASGLDIGNVSAGDTIAFWVGPRDLGMRPIRVYKNGKPLFDPVTPALGIDFTADTGRPGYTYFGVLTGFNGAQFTANTGRRPPRYTATAAAGVSVAPVPLISTLAILGAASTSALATVQAALSAEASRAIAAEGYLDARTTQSVVVTWGLIADDAHANAFLNGYKDAVAMVADGYSGTLLAGANGARGSVLRAYGDGVNVTRIASSSVSELTPRIITYVDGATGATLLLSSSATGTPAQVTVLDAVYPALAAAGWNVIASSKYPAAQVVTKTLTADATTIPEVPATALAPFTLIVNQDGAGSHALTWPAGWRFPGGARPVITATPYATDLFQVTPMGLGQFLVSGVAQNLS